MKYIFELAATADITISVEQKHKEVVEGLESLEKPWGIESGIYPTPEFGKGIVAVFRLNKLLSSGIKGDVMYRYRNLLKKNDDDRIYIQFNPQKIDYAIFTSQIFKKYISFFNPYRAIVSDETVRNYDFENRLDSTELLKLIRFHPIFYWKDQYCKEITSFSSFDFNKIISNYVEFSELFEGGIIVIISSKLINIEEANELNSMLNVLLNEAKM